MENRVKSQTNKLKRAFELYLARKVMKNFKMIWKYINSKSKTRSGDLAIYPEDPKSTLTNDNAVKAKILSGFFSRVFIREPNNDVPCLCRMETHQQMLPLIITVDAVTKLHKKLKVDKYPDQVECTRNIYRRSWQEFPAPLLQEYSKNRWMKGYYQAIGKGQGLAPYTRKTKIATQVTTGHKAWRQWYVSHGKLGTGAYD